MTKWGMGGMEFVIVLCIGVVVPIAALQGMQQGLNVAVGLIVIVAAILGAVTLGIVSMGISVAKPFVEGSPDDEERLKVLRASHRALLEEMDDEISLLKEIRDSLRHVEGGQG